MCGKYDDVREVPGSDETNNAEWPCCRVCFMKDEFNSDPPMDKTEKEAMFKDCIILN